MFDVFGSYSPALLAFLATLVLIGGIVRGFAGFGAGMIFMPVASSQINPATAAATFLFIDGIIALPLVVRAMRICDWTTVLPVVIGSVLFVHLGAWLLANSDVLTLRWILFAVVTTMLALLVSGWRYQGQPTRSMSFGVGSVAGVLAGVSQVSAPPVVAFWLTGKEVPSVVRANLIVYFALASVGTFVAYILNGFFTINVWHLLVAAIPAYALGLFIGSRGFSRADPKYYRWLAYALIALAALVSMPALDPLLR
ncbi:sulfite exporter TauE/SafE family protein [Roseibium hamelinense]|nr:sulfite exporter TauE/SafE family protein [Roseibium hamelinense]